ncbi:FAD-dependent oxidoreductase [Picrophilus oshimae]|uniref:NADH dehydrogenase n=1 Tax=Picrophilus torridus (strain ATCC 700027 / DSM 9790 / JCM 10055 / NBRC 100828 / KAW 2/3) TaxID=1122961 RepID=A0A8G2L8B5_PICTO|nr:FAD-dependent oxidoreductase [Picrophilus oshimae]SMD31260.1 NADH dehydrogenase [Picrophilus oshimae DSM 9789]
MEKIFILGAGISGIYSKLTNRKAFLMDKYEKIIINSRLINIISGNDSNAIMERKLDIKDKIINIDFANRLIETVNNKYNYDKIIIALGSSQNVLPGTVGLNSIDDAYSIKNLSENAKKICIIGGGYLGVELAGIFRERSIIVSPFIMEKNKAAGTYLERLLIKMGVSIIKDRALEYKNKKLILKNSEVECDLAIYAGGTTGNHLISNLDIKSNRSSIIVDKYLRSVEYDDVYACGASAYFNEPMTVYNAMKSGIIAMKNIMGHKIEYKPDNRNIVNINNNFYLINSKGISKNYESTFIKIIKNARSRSTDHAIGKINSL